MFKHSTPQDDFARVVSPTDPMSTTIQHDASYFSDESNDRVDAKVKASLPPPPVFMSPSRGYGSPTFSKSLSLRKQKRSPRSSPSPSQMQRKKAPRTKSVSFDESVFVRQYYSSLSLADNDKSTLWYSQEDLVGIMDKNRVLVEKVMSNNGDPTTRCGKALCLRGLEKYLNPCAHFVQRDLAKKVVLAEQCLQLTTSTTKKVDADHIAFLYKITTRRSKIAAAEKATQDTKAVQPYLRTLKRKTSLMPRRHSLEGLYKKNVISSATA